MKQGRARRRMLSLPAALLVGLLAMAAAAHAARAEVASIFLPADQIARRCPAILGPAQEQRVMKEIFPQVIRHTPGRDAGAAQLFAPIRAIGKPLALEATRCLAGEQAACQRFSDWISRLASEDALRFDAGPHRLSPASLVTGKLAGNLTLRPIALHLAALRERGLAGKDEAVDAWLVRRAGEYRHLPRQLDDKAAQNLVLHSALTGLAVEMATGGSGQALQTAARIYRLYLDTMRSDGSLPQETRRGASALKYDSMAVGNLLLLALLAQTRGLPLLAYAGPHGDLHQAAGFVAAALEDEAVIAGYAQENVAPTDAVPAHGGQARGFLRDNSGWMAWYGSLYPGRPASPVLVRERRRALPAALPAFPYDESLGLAPPCLLASSP